MGKHAALAEGPRIAVSTETYDRLAALDLNSISLDDLARAIEAEAVKLFRLRQATLRASANSTLGASESGGVIPVGDLDLICEGPLHRGWEDEARLFSAQVTSLLRAHRAITLNRRHEAEISALYETVAQLTARRDVGAVLKTVVERARELLSSDLAYIMLLDSGGKTLTVRVASGNRTDAFLKIRRPVRPGVSAYTGKPVITADFLNDSALDHHPTTDDLVRLEGVRSVMAVPLRTDLAPLGTLCVANRFVKSFTDGEVSLLNSLGEHAALALDNARLYEEAVSAAAASAAARAEAETHLLRLERAESVHHKLTEVLLAGEGVPAVAATLAEFFNAGFLITDWRHSVLADVNSALVDRSGALLPSLRRRRDVSQALDRCASDFLTVEVPPDLVVAPIAARRELLGYIWARRLDKQEQDDVLWTSLEQAARVVALEMMREREAVETERRLRRDFMYELLSDHASEPNVLESRAKQMWRGYAAEHRPLVVSVLSRSAIGASPLERARRLLSEDRPGDFITVYGSHLIVLTSSTETSRTTVEAEAIQSLLAQNGMATGIVIGAVCRGLTETRFQAMTVLRLMELLKPTGIVWSSGLEALTQLFDPSQRDRLESFVRSTLRPLKGNTDYMATLIAYYEAAGNRTDAARRLRIHVNTLRSRLDRISELIGGSIDESARSVPLRVALLARAIYKTD